MSSSSPSGFEHHVQVLVGEPTTPRRRLADRDAVRLDAAKRTLDQNYFEIDEYVDGDLATNPMLVCPQDRRREEAFETIRLLHNYLSSLYSFNETVRVLFNDYTATGTRLRTGDFTPASGGSTRSYYGRKLSFLRGIRTDFQHGGFSCLSFEKTGELGDFGGYHVEFQRESFVEESGVDGANRFLQHTNQREQRYPLCFVDRFHRETVREFHEDTEAWFELQ